LNKPRKFFVTLPLLGSCLLLSLAACGNNQTRNLHQQNVNNQHPVSTINPNATKNMDQKYRIADQTATQLTKVPGVQQANVLVSDRNAYVAAVLNRDVPYTPALENQIAAEVKKVDPQIDKVYISVNPDFVGRVSTYVNDVRNGRPVSGLVNDLSDLVNRMFPKAR
jgi:spore cortex protein